MNEPLERLINNFRSLPGVGYKTAQRYAYFIVESSKQKVKQFTDIILLSKDEIKYCKECGAFADSDVCPLCEKRNKEIICVVAEPKDVDVMEKIKTFDGVYHVLGGTLNPLENRGPNELRIKQLLERINRYNAKEVIMATNPDVEGDATAMYIAKLLKPLGIKVTRIAQGISMGTDLEFADEISLLRAMEARTEI